MSWRTSAIVVAARDLGRMLGLNNILARLLSNNGYEVNYDTAFCSELEPGDCVWDVGANIGYYSKQFARQIGESGTVFAFEPSPVNYAKLVNTCDGLTNVRPIQIALGSETTTLPFEQGTDELGATSRIVTNTVVGSLLVDVHPGLALVEDGIAARPNAIKVDVEGFELEVLRGLGALIRDTSLRLLGLEIHFRILNSRGMKQAAAEIEGLLADAGFQIAWPDSSHMIAKRPRS